ncbi:hypothetical protein ABIC83_002512 [Roseateles asaccharophilus]|uniref:hypothetical protein n=1 Tax=Roseateles asaccharophilus TaxID=582607 RepID=UPI0038383FF7
MKDYTVAVTLWSPGNTFEFELEPDTMLRCEAGNRSKARAQAEQPVFEATLTLLKNYPHGGAEKLETVKLTGDEWTDVRENLNVQGFMKDVLESGETDLKGQLFKRLMPGPVPAPQHAVDAAAALGQAGFRARTWSHIDSFGGKRERRSYMSVDVPVADPRFSWSDLRIQVTPICAQTCPSSAASSTPSGFDFNDLGNGTFSVSVDCTTEAHAKLATQLFLKPLGADGKIVGPASLPKARHDEILASLGATAPARPRPR